MYRLVLLTEAQTRVVYPKELYGLRIPAFSKVCGDKVKDAVISVAVQRKSEANRHRVESWPAKLTEVSGSARVWFALSTRLGHVTLLSHIRAGTVQHLLEPSLGLSWSGQQRRSELCLECNEGGGNLSIFVSCHTLSMMENR